MADDRLPEVMEKTGCSEETAREIRDLFDPQVTFGGRPVWRYFSLGRAKEKGKERQKLRLSDAARIFFSIARAQALAGSRNIKGDRISW